MACNGLWKNGVRSIERNTCCVAFKIHSELAVVVHTSHPSIWEAKVVSKFEAKDQMKTVSVLFPRILSCNNFSIH